MKRLFAGFIISSFLLINPALAETTAYKPAEFPALLPSLGAAALPASPNNAGGDVLIHQNFWVKDQNVDLFTKQYLKDLRSKDWQIEKYLRQPKGRGETTLMLAASHSEGYELRLVIVDLPQKSEAGLKVKVVLRKKAGQASN